MPDDRSDDPVSRAVALAQALRHVSQADIASLRRTAPPAKPLAFWKLWFEHKLEGSEEAWAWIVHALALLTPAGKPGERQSAHDGSARPGAALHGPDRNRPRLSEARLLRLLEMSFEERRPALVRALRRLAAERAGVHAGDLAWLMLSDTQETRDTLARQYFSAAGAAKAEEKTDA